MKEIIKHKHNFMRISWFSVNYDSNGRDYKDLQQRCFRVGLNLALCLLNGLEENEKTSGKKL